jgi:thiol-disulfide isomerase/thioredoxin
MSRAFAIRIGLVLAGLLLAAAAGVHFLRPSPTAEAALVTASREPMPELTFSTLGGNETSLTDFTGRVVVLNLWATWCAPCREEMPSLDALQAMFPKDEVTVLALSVDRTGKDKILDFLQEVGIKRLTVAHDASAKAPRTLKVPGLPATILVDRKGREAGRVLGIEDWAGPDPVAAVEALLAEGG